MIIKKATKDDFDRMADIWEDSVASTYDFLTMKEIAGLKKIIREKYFPNPDITYYILNDGDETYCFSGVIGDKIEFLFVDSSKFGYGLGKAMLVYVLKHHSATKVDIHEANMHALTFYSKYGFEIKEKVEKNIFGRLYPVCHLKLSGDIGKAIEKLESMD